VDFVEELPRLPTGKLQKKLIRAPYWAGQGSQLAAGA
jgi:acyl-CoA synthetase (AMP-forming)/AMP-acid ligase II